MSSPDFATVQEEYKWTNQPESLPAGDPDSKKQPAEVVKAYFQAMTDSDWDEMRKFTPESDVQQTKRQTAQAKEADVPLPTFEVGEASWSQEQSCYFVKYRLKWVKKYKMGIRNDNAAKHWMVDGGI
jgi:hypothetical protein